MLIHLDESLHHQSSRPFRMAGFTDHRFFDRYWFEAVDPSGATALIAGMAFYKNLGTCDGYVSVREGFQQHNLRLARPLDDDPDTTTLGPLRISVVEPFRHLRMELDPNPSGLALELDWHSDYPAYVEAHHLDVVQQRVAQDSTRYNQVGRWEGWLEVAGTRRDVRSWWGSRDHSWGVRPGVGGFEPSSGRPGRVVDLGLLLGRGLLVPVPGPRGRRGPPRVLRRRAAASRGRRPAAAAGRRRRRTTCASRPAPAATSTPASG